MRLYELVLVLKTSLSEAERTKVLDAIKDEDWGQKPLSYKIKKEAAGVYHMLKLEGENPVPADFEARLLRNDNVLRHLLVRVK
jgi:small subunit ribosomal protein S6